MGTCEIRWDLLGPAFERSPATDAVAIMEPEGVCFDFEVLSMAFAAYLVAKKTLVRFDDLVSYDSSEADFLSNGVPPQNVCPHRLHELISINL